MITCLHFVPRGASAAQPERFEPSEQLMARLQALAAGEEDGEADGDGEQEGGAMEEEEGAERRGGGAGRAGKQEVDVSDLPAALRMDEYDDDDDDAGLGNGEEGDQLEMMMQLAGVAREGEGEEGEGGQGDDEDPTTRKRREMGEAASRAGRVLAGKADGEGALDGEDEDDDDDDEDEEDAEDITLKRTDAVFCLGRIEDELPQLEVHCYDQETGGMFLHHDFPLPEFPLCLAWMDIPPLEGMGNQVGSYMAVGTFQPAIEIWNLDVLDPLEPSAVLGGEQQGSSIAAAAAGGGGSKKNRKKKRQQRPQLVPGSHEDAVLALAWNRQHRQLLASGSKDMQVKLWDVVQQQCAATFPHHMEAATAMVEAGMDADALMVQDVQWHPYESTHLATGGNQLACVFDASQGPASRIDIVLPANLEHMAWDPHNPSVLAIALDGKDGDTNMVSVDVRQPSTFLCEWAAHAATVSKVAFNPLVPGMLITASEDGFVNVWDTAATVPSKTLDGADTGFLQPVQIASKAMAAGRLLAMDVYRDEPWLLAAAGSKGMIAVWEPNETGAIETRFGDRALSAAPAYQRTDLGLAQAQAASAAGTGGDGEGEGAGDGGDAADVEAMPVVPPKNGKKKRGKNKGKKR